MAEITPEVRELVRERVTSMDHVEVLMRLYEAKAGALSVPEIERTARLGAEITATVLTDLVNARLAAHEPASAMYRYAASAADRATVEDLAALYHQRPVTLVKLVYSQPPTPVKHFADAFRLRDKPKGE